MKVQIDEAKRSAQAALRKDGEWEKQMTYAREQVSKLKGIKAELETTVADKEIQIARLKAHIENVPPRPVLN
jgi:chromosome segregation ATPase